MKVAFDNSYDPPAPVLPVHVSGINRSGAGLLLHALVDTGADCSVIPARLVRTLRLPLVDKVSVKGFAGKAEPLAVHAVQMRVAGRRLLARVVAFGTEPLLGRDILNQFELRLDGPSGVCQVASPKRTRRR